MKLEIMLCCTLLCVLLCVVAAVVTLIKIEQAISTIMWKYRDKLREPPPAPPLPEKHRPKYAEPTNPPSTPPCKIRKGCIVIITGNQGGTPPAPDIHR